MRHFFCAFLLLLSPLTKAGYAKNSGIEDIDLSRLPEYAGEFLPQGWGYRARVVVPQNGLKQLNLPPFVLARIDSSLRDLRLARDGRQVPYILEHLGNPQSLTPELIPDSKQTSPRLSVWKLSLPLPNLPLHTLICEISDPVFARKASLFEWRKNSRGEKIRYELGAATWQREMGDSVEPCLLALGHSPETDSLNLEIQNGDNAPLSFSKLELQYQTARLIFKASGESPLWLYYGNSNSTPPSYDAIPTLREFSSRPSEPVSLSSEEVLQSNFWSLFSPASPLGKSLFWLVLAGVVTVLLLAIAKLLPDKK